MEKQKSLLVLALFVTTASAASVSHRYHSNLKNSKNVSFLLKDLCFYCYSSWVLFRQKVVMSRDRTSLLMCSAPLMFSKESPLLPSLGFLKNPNLTPAGMVSKYQFPPLLTGKENLSQFVHHQVYCKRRGLLSSVSRLMSYRPRMWGAKTASTSTSGSLKANMVQ